MLFYLCIQENTNVQGNKVTRVQKELTFIVMELTTLLWHCEVRKALLKSHPLSRPLASSGSSSASLAYDLMNTASHDSLLEKCSVVLAVSSFCKNKFLCPVLPEVALVLLSECADVQGLDKKCLYTVGCLYWTSWMPKEMNAENDILTCLLKFLLLFPAVVTSVLLNFALKRILHSAFLPINCRNGHLSTF